MQQYIGIVGSPVGCRLKGAGSVMLLMAALIGEKAGAQQSADPELATIAVSPSSGEASDSPGLTRTSDDEPDQIAEVIVTATKRAKALREIPATISSISGEDLEQRNAQGVQDIVKLVPGVNYTEAPDSPSRITVRGISAQPGTSFTTGVLFGDVSFTDQYVPLVALDPNPFDLKSVDVLKGPQGTLFGASGFNGAVRYVPTPPTFGEWQVKYFGEYTQYSHGDLRPSYGAAVNVPFGDDAALRLTGFDRNSPGYVNNLSTGVKDSNRVDQDGVRGILGWQPVDRLNVRLTGAWQNTHVADSSTADNDDGDLSSHVRPRASPQRNNYELGDLNLDYALDSVSLISETSYVHKELHNFFDASSRVGNGALPLLAQVYFAHSDSYTQEIRLVSPDRGDSVWQWVGGAFASHQKVYDQLNINAGDPSIPADQLLPIINMLPGLSGLTGTDADGQLDLVSTISNVVVQEVALFGEVTRRFGKDLELTLGGRFYETRSGGTNTQGGALVLGLTGMPNNVVDATIHEQGFNPKAALFWHLTPDITTYALTTKGFRVGGVQVGLTLPPSPPAPATFASDTIWNYEAGLRTQWFHNALHFDISGFYERWKNPQYLQPDSTGLLTYITNVGGVRTVGGEASLLALLPIKGLSLSIGGAYANTVTTKPFQASDGSDVPVGSRFPFAPHWQTATTLSYLNSFASWTVNTALTHSYLGKATNNLAQEASVFGYQQWDFNVNLENESIRWLPQVTLSLNNFLDSRGVVNRVYSTGASSYDDYTYTPPRAITLKLSGSF